MGNTKTTSLIIGAAIVIGILFLSFGGGFEYQDRDTRDIDRKALFATTQSLLEESEAWPVELNDGTVEVKSSLEPHPVRTVRYEITELDATLDEAIAYIRDHTYGGLERRVTPDKYEDTLWQPDDTLGPLPTARERATPCTRDPTHSWDKRTSRTSDLWL